MITLVTAQDMRTDLGDITVRGRNLTEWATWAIEQIARDFIKPDLRVVMEVVGPTGEICDHFDGRLLNPGHSIEAAWFIMREARIQQRTDWRRLGVDMLRWMWARGWDREHGGLLYFTDVYNKPVQEYWHHMKFWWPHNEAIIATLMAHIETGEEDLAEMHRQVHEWTFRHFPDPEHGEWFGYLDRFGQPTTELKGSMWKGPFHLPRQLLLCWKMLEEIKVKFGQDENFS
jgi:N-acylglucosamine 2-epimerase